MRIDPAVVAIATESHTEARAPSATSSQSHPASSSDDVALAFG